MKKAILRYYLSDIVNPNNKQSIKGSEINARIEELRNILLDKFDWRDKGHIVFMPNAYYAKKTLLHFLFNCQPFKDLKFFSNSQEHNGFILEKEEGLDVKYIKKWKEIKERCFATFSLDSIEEPKNRVLGMDSGQYLFVETVFDDPVNVSGADAFIFNVISGVSVLGFRKGMEIEPIILGSNSVTYADEQIYELSRDFRCLECGTPNVPLLLAIRSFYKSQ